MSAGAQSTTNILDRLVGFFSPQAAVSRSRARIALGRLRAYEGGKIGRRTDGWITANSSANVEITSSLEKLRQRSRDLCRNNPHAAKAINSLVANYIGTGIIGKPSLGEDVWQKWIKECDADGQHDFYGLQALVLRTMLESGECLVRFRYRLPADGMDVPLQLQVLEPDYLDTFKTENLANGGYIINGVEFNAIGKRVAYWLFPQHPGELGQLYKVCISQRISADEVLHIYEKTRPGQVRGVPRLTPVLMTFRDLDDYEEAELLRKGIEACFAVFVTGSESGEASLGPELPAGKSGSRIEEINAGMIHYTENGQSVTFGQPSAVPGHNDFIRGYQHKLAAGSRCTYEQMTGDLSKVNYSSIRAGIVEFRRDAEQFQWLTFIPMLCEPVADAFERTGKLAGKIKRTAVTWEWATPKWDWVDPVKDVTGELLEIASGLKPWQEAVRRRGADPKTVIQQIAEDQKAFAAAGIAIQIEALALGAAAAAQQTGDNSNANSN